MKNLKTLDVGTCPVCGQRLRSIGLADMKTQTIKAPELPTNDATICPNCLHIIGFSAGEWHAIFAGSFLDMSLDMIVQLHQMRSKLKLQKLKESKKAEGDQSLIA